MRQTITNLLILLILLSFGGVAAKETLQGDQCEVAANETLKDSLFTLCRTLVINGRVEGDVIGIATDAKINGTVDGDVYLLAGQLEVAGEITGNLHFGGAVLRLLPTSRFSGERSDLISVGLSATLDKGSHLPGGVTTVGYQLDIKGDVDGAVNFWGSALQVDGIIGRGVDATVGDPQSTGISQVQTLLIPFPWDVKLLTPGLIVGENGQIQGKLRYSAPVEGTVSGTVTGGSDFQQVVAQPDLTAIITEEEGSRQGLSVYISQILREFITLVVLGLLGLTFVPRLLQTPLRQMQARPLSSLGVGMLSFIVSFPVLVIVVLFSIVIVFLLAQLGIESLLLIGAGILALFNLVCASVFYFVAIFISRVLVCLWIGRVIVRFSVGDEENTRVRVTSLLVGVLVLAILAPLPTIGWVVNGLTLFLGLGAVILTLQSQLRRDNPAFARNGALIPRRGADSAIIAPPLRGTISDTPGMDNLPEGFSWWDNTD